MKYLFIIINLFFSTTFAQTKVGTTAATFLGIGTGARAMGMGGAVTACLFDASNNYWNPGTISRINGNQFHITGAEWLVDTRWNLISGILRPDDIRAIGFYITHLDYGKEQVTTLDQQMGTDDFWKAIDMALGITYSQNLTDRFSLGTAAKYIYQSIYNENAVSGAFDFGLLYQNIENSLRLGMTISNLGFDMIMSGKDLFKRIDLDPDSDGNNETIVASLKTDYWPLPIFFKVGIAKDLHVFNSSLLTFSIDGVIPSDDVEHLNLGSELKLNKYLYLRSGYRHIGKIDSEDSITLGVGAKLNLFTLPAEFNYAYQNYGVFGYLSHVGLTLNY